MSDSCEFGKWLSRPPPGDEVVITGISGRFPESNNIHEYKENLFNKVDMVTDDDRRLKLDHPEVPKRNGKIYNINKIDAGYFGLHYRQADIMDPMTRKCLECAIEAIIDSGVNPSELEGSKTAVLVGACYADMEIETLSNITKSQSFAITGYLRGFIAHRISYFLKLKGSSTAIDTACSSSMNALELAFKYIRMGKCDNAIVGGVNLLLHPGMTRQFFRLGVIGSEGTCRVFDEKANGYARSEAVAFVFLQKAKNAKRIYANVIYSKVSDDGFKPLGITFPSKQMQQELMEAILKDSGVVPSELSFMEAHGTGTQVGDPQEVEAIDEAIARKRTEPLLIGSVKCSIGHSEPASGLCSVAKVIIAMETGYIAPNIHLNSIKKGMLGFEEGRMKAVTELTKLDREDAIIGVNNFGLGGNNAHVLLKRFNKVKKNGSLPEDDIPRLVCVSGRTKKAVLTLLDSVNNTPLDNEYVGLLHHIFKQDVAGHVYRGYAIVSKTNPIKTGLRLFSEKNPLCLIFGNFEKGYKVLGPYLMKFECFRTTINIINEIRNEDALSKENSKILMEADHDIFDSFAIQIAIVEMFKMLEIELLETVNGDTIGEIITAYYHKDISLKEAVYEIYDFIRKRKNSKSEASVEQLTSIFRKNKNRLRSQLNLLPSSNIRQSNSLILNISDNMTVNSSSLLFVKDNNVRFLEVLGRIYKEGHSLQLHKLYPNVQFPVSRSTLMISPFIRWDYRKNWRTFKFGEFDENDVIQQEYNISTSIYEDQKFILGHVIDGRNMIPATEYLESVRKTLVKEINNLSIVFENCKFHKAVTAPKSGVIKFLVSIQKSNGNFEIVEKDSVVVSGRVFLTKDVEEHQNDLPAYDIQKCRTEFLEQDEIYRELYLRGYNYTGLFKGIVKCNVDASAALVKWENNLTTFLDKMMQIKLLQTNTRSLYVPVSIRRLSINLLKHSQLTESLSDSLCPVFIYKEANIIKSGGIEISGAQAAAISKKKSAIVPVLEKHVFVPNNIRISLEDSIRVITQIILENSMENNFKAIEIFDDSFEENYELLSPLFSKALDDVPSVVVSLTVSTKKCLHIADDIKVENFVLTPTSNLLLIVTTNIFQKPNLLNQSLNALSPNGFLLSRESVDSDLDTVQNIEILVEHVVGGEKLILLQKVKKSTASEIVQVTTEDFDWLSQLQKALKKDIDVLVYSQNREPEGILGFVNCLRREPKSSKVNCFFIMDSAPKFDIKDPFYETQIRKKMAINIYKDGKWGTYRYLLLDDVHQVEGEHFFLKNTAKGDLSGLKWVEGSLTSNTKLSDDKIIVFPVYSSLNFKDIMIALGRVSVEAFTWDRIEQESCQGIEFCGRDTKRRRVMGMTSKAALATMVVADTNFLWEIPQNWSFQDASTVIVVYSTVVYGLLKVIQLKRGMSILIHSATGGIGLAALNVCLYYGCDIYVTVGTQEKKDYLKKNVPQILETHIGNSRDASFVEMINRETNGRGVDVILNSLSEEKLKASIRCMALGGNFLEIGKFDIYRDISLDLLLLEKNINYHGVMLDGFFAKSSEQKKWIFHKINEGLRLGYIKPLPRTIFKFDEVVKAYKFMTTGKHIGKVVIQVRDENCEIELQKELFRGYPRFTCDPKKSYIIVGGLGGFGLELADWLYLREVKSLILVSRSGIQSGYQKQRIKFLKECGVTVRINTTDVTTKQGCVELIREANRLAPVDGIFNLAVVLKDALFENLNEEAFAISLAPKAHAIIYLDQITRESCPGLRYFVVFSSISCGRGNAGQTNYGMANSIMERICERRKFEGFPGLAIQWGAIGDVGLVAKMQKEKRELVIGGTLQQKISSCLEVFDKFLKQDNPIVSSMMVAEKSNKTGLESAIDVVAYILGIKDIKTVSPHTTFAELGMDSMMGTEMIQILEKDFEIYVTAKEVRNLTFAKLVELEAQEKTNENKQAKTEMGIDILLKYVPNDDSTKSPTVKLPSQVSDDEKGKTVFVFPGVEGVFQGMEFFTKNLKNHVLGIQYSFYDCETSITEYAEKIKASIEATVCKEKTFNFIGYSFGSIVAAEVASLLEDKGFTGCLVVIDGSPAYISKTAREMLPTDNENEFETLLLFKILSLVLPVGYVLQAKDKFLSCKNLEERFELAKLRLPSTLVKNEDLQKYIVFALCNRLKFVSNYKFELSKIKSPVHLFKASIPMIVNFAEDYQLSEICEEEVQVTLIDGDHYSILNQNQLVEDINRILAE